MKAECQINNEAQIDVKTINRAVMYALSCIQDGLYGIGGFPVVRCVTHMNTADAIRVAKSKLGPDVGAIQFLSWGCNDRFFSGHCVYYIVCSSGCDVQFFRVFGENLARLRVRDRDGDHRTIGQSIDFIL